MRRQHDAIMVGSGTVISDDPSLNVRDLGECLQPARVILSSKLQISEKSNLGKTVHEQPVWIFHSSDAPEERKSWLEKGLSYLSARLIMLAFQYRMFCKS